MLAAIDCAYPMGKEVNFLENNSSNEEENSLFDSACTDSAKVKLNSVTDEKEKDEKDGFFQCIANLFKGIAGFFKNIFSKIETETQDAEEAEVSKDNEAQNTTPTESLEPEVVEQPTEITREQTVNKPESDVNGLIDEQVKQGQKGDCALISSILSLSYTKEGEDLIKDAIKINKNESGEIESYDVTFKGINETYSFNAKELDELYERVNGGETVTKNIYPNGGTVVDIFIDPGTQEYSKGDKDMLLLELAVEKAFNESKNEKLQELITSSEDRDQEHSEDLLWTVNPSSVLYLFKGEEMETASAYWDNYNDRFKEFFPDAELEYKYTSEVLDEFDENSVAILGNETVATIVDVNNNVVEMANEHAYSIKNVEGDTITLVNPWNSSEDIVVNRKELEKLDYVICFEEQCA